jgi:hypothetical protein
MEVPRSVRRPIRKLLLVLAGLLLVVVAAGVAGFLWLRYAPRHVPDGQPALAHLDEASLPRFREKFNAGVDGVRVMVLLSPT